MSHFKLISSTKTADVIPVNKYVSEKTGLKVIIANVEGPLVKGFFCLATEAHDDDGLPHTLEHLIFLGSERYPYKGVLDLLANRCMAHGTNAWTDVDHTCYTIHTAGDAGMLTLLPIYLDHILRPTLTEEAFITEVHHIDGEGNDAGVVYCEMQGRQNTSDSRCELRLQRAMYPNSGYSSETGGIMENLRTSTNNVKVREFHKKFYRAENLTIILTGQIEAEDVFKALATVEDDIIAKREKEPIEEWVKPWTTIPPPANYGELREYWPADTEDCGQVLFAWRGPALTAAAALAELTACAVLLRYLCDTPAAPLQRRLVERERALAGDISYNITENLAPMLKIELDNVPIDKLEEARDEARDCLRRVVRGEDAVDMERLRRILRKQLREILAAMESDPHHAIAFRCIGDALYSQNERDFISRMNPQYTLDELMSEDLQFWLGILRKYFTDDLITIVGSPSIDLQTNMANDERVRIEKQRELLGETGLAEKAKILEEAIEFNERAPPPGMLAVEPPPAELRRHALSGWSSRAACPHLDLRRLPLFARVHSLRTNFVYINLILDTSTADESTRKWLTLHLNAMGECPVWRDDTLIPHEEVISTTEQITVMLNNELGFGRTGNFAVGQFSNFVLVETRCEPSDYEKVVDHLYEILYKAEMTKERLLVFTQRLLNDVAQVRRNGNKMVHDILWDSMYKKDSNVHWNSVLRQQKFLKDLMDQLNAGGDSAQAAIDEAKRTYKNLTENVWLHLATDFERYKLSVEPWMKFAKENQITPSEPRLQLDAELLRGAPGAGAGVGGLVVGVGGLESSFVVQLSAGPLGYAPEHAAPLAVALNYFTQLEGPMWRLIRGGGLSYGYGIRPSHSEGLIVFSLYRATNTVAAYTKARSIVEDFLADGEFDEDLFASAKSSTLFEVVENEKCPADVVKQSLLNYIKQQGDSYNRAMAGAVAAVSRAAAAAAARRWLPALAGGARLAAACRPGAARDVQAAFRKINVELEVFESMEASPFNN